MTTPSLDFDVLKYGPFEIAGDGMNERMPCPQCGEPCGDFHEGVYISCWLANQTALDQHNAEFDHWNGLTDEERDRAIRNAVRP